MYQALYRKYRPLTFDDVAGQRSVTETLKNQLVSGRLSHAYLFTGTRGTGKTSCAKILARAVNCENPQNGNPCNVCPSCRSILDGGCMDVLEIDAASNNGVDSVRALRDDAIYTPASVKMRVYIIDEVHMLSTAAFNALLKIIEEPPAHLLFILATTELHKVPATILSRCQRFSFRRLLPEDIAARLTFVAYQENIAIEPEAIDLLARLADGALRDGLSLLDQCAAAVSGPLDAEAVYRCLGLAGDRKTAALMEAVAAHDAAKALELFSGLYQNGKDPAAVLDELCSLARDLLVLKTAPKIGRAMVTGVCTDAELQALLGRFSAGELLRVTNLLQAAQNSGGDPRLSAELCLLRLCAPELQLDAASLNARLSRVEQQLASGVTAVSSPPAEAIEADRPPFPEDRDDPLAEAPPAKAPEKPDTEELPVGFWTDLLSALSGQVPPGTRGLLQQVQPALRGDTLRLGAPSEFVKNVVGEAGLLQLIAKEASRLLGRPVRPRAALLGENGEEQARLEELLAFGAAHDDIIEIKS